MVALLAEGVDRNVDAANVAFANAHVALLAEGVDRNSTCSVRTSMRSLSPSSRRAWIEIEP